MSCLMHMEGILRKKNSKVKVIHIAEILNGVQIMVEDKRILT
jgi:L-lactate dehydrogenase complex protein LldE